MEVQRVKAIENVKADVGRVALRYGPMIYNIESADQNVDLVLKPDATLKAKWEPNLLGGVVAIHGYFAGGEELTAVAELRGGITVAGVRWSG